MNLTELKPAKGSTFSKRVRGRGDKTARKGHKGQNARSGGGVRPGFEGGQMPLYRRLPKKGFKNTFAKKYNSINVERLAIFEAGAVVDIAMLLEKGIISKPLDGVVVMGRGEIANAITVKANRFTASARAKIEGVGGTVETIN